MKLAITVYPDDLAEADRIIHLLRGVRGLELDSYMGKARVEKVFDKQHTSFAGSENGQSESGKNDDTDDTSTSHPSTRPNISPGEPSIGKIGSDTKKNILESLDVNVQPAAKYSEHLKLLWKRGEVKFDGREYYV